MPTVHGQRSSAISIDLTAARAGQAFAKGLDESLEELPAAEREAARAALETERVVEAEVHTQQSERGWHTL